MEEAAIEIVEFVKMSVVKTTTHKWKLIIISHAYLSSNSEISVVKSAVIKPEISIDPKPKISIATTRTAIA